MRELSLFTGAGGGLLGTHLLGWKPIGYVEYDDYCQKVIDARIKDGILPRAPIFGDINAFISEGYAAAYTGMVDVISAGFPCQPFSVAGKGEGENDPRNQWPATLDTLRIIRPRYALLENVPGLLAHEYIRRIYADLALLGYNCRWRRLSAAEMGAPHKRDRWWLVATDTNQSDCGQRSNWQSTGEKLSGICQGALPRAHLSHTQSERCREARPDSERPEERITSGGDSLANTSGKGLPWPARARQRGIRETQGESEGRKSSRAVTTRGQYWAIEPDVGGVANELADRLDIFGGAG